MRGEAGGEKTPATPINQCANTKPIIGGSESTEGAETSRAEGQVLNAGITALGARQSPVYRLEIKVASSPLLDVPLPPPPFPSSSPSPPPGESQVLASDGQEMSRPDWTADDDTVLLFCHLEKSFTAVCVSFYPSFCFLSQEMKIPCGAAVAPHGFFL